MKKIKIIVTILVLMFVVSSCSNSSNTQDANLVLPEGAVAIDLSDNEITVNGEKISSDDSYGVYAANDIVYYEKGKGFAYGEGREDESYSKEDAETHTVVHITEPGTYGISGKLSFGQIAIDLGKRAKHDPDAVVTLILNGIDINCEVAPAVIFYNVYECGDDDEDDAIKDVDTSSAGANVIISDGTVNNINGLYVARIYDPESVILNEDETAVQTAEKLHKYDGAFYSKMSMNINGGKEGTGVLNIKAENEGLDSEMHLTINGGNINIESGNDGINTNEDEVSVTTINGGNIKIKVTGESGEGDGIDSNGWIVINDGTLNVESCSSSMDAGLDSDMGTYINGGIVVASGNMLDGNIKGEQASIAFSLKENKDGGETVYIKDKYGEIIDELAPQNGYNVLIYSTPYLDGTKYTLWDAEKQLAISGENIVEGPGMGGMRPKPYDDMEVPEEMESVEIIPFTAT